MLVAHSGSRPPAESPAVHRTANGAAVDAAILPSPVIAARPTSDIEPTDMVISSERVTSAGKDDNSACTVGPDDDDDVSIHLEERATASFAETCAIVTDHVADPALEKDVEPLSASGQRGKRVRKPVVTYDPAAEAKKPQLAGGISPRSPRQRRACRISGAKAAAEEPGFSPPAAKTNATRTDAQTQEEEDEEDEEEAAKQVCVKCGGPFDDSQEATKATWGRAGKHAGQKYHAQCKELPWPNEEKVETIAKTDDEDEADQASGKVATRKSKPFEQKENDQASGKVATSKFKAAAEQEVSPKPRVLPRAIVKRDYLNPRCDTTKMHWDSYRIFLTYCVFCRSYGSAISVKARTEVTILNAKSGEWWKVRKLDKVSHACTCMLV